EDDRPGAGPFENAAVDGVLFLFPGKDAVLPKEELGADKPDAVADRRVEAGKFVGAGNIDHDADAVAAGRRGGIPGCRGLLGVPAAAAGPLRLEGGPFGLARAQDDAAGG